MGILGYAGLEAWCAANGVEVTMEDLGGQLQIEMLMRTTIQDLRTIRVLWTYEATPDIMFLTLNEMLEDLNNTWQSILDEIHHPDGPKIQDVINYAEQRRLQE